MSQLQRFFIALLPPQEIQDYANEIKQHFADRYQSKAAQKSPPHVTLQPPFEWPTATVSQLTQHLAQFAQRQPAIPMTLEGFGAFPPKVIFINVQKTPELLDLQAVLVADLAANLAIADPRAKTRPFAPHLTVAFRDLTKQNFKSAWPEFQHRPCHFDFQVAHLTLLLHNGQRWLIHEEFPFRN